MGILGMSALETSLLTGFTMVLAVLDHTPSSFLGSFRGGGDIKLSHHEIHHNVDSKCNYSQPFTPFMDWLFGTLYVEGGKREEAETNKSKKNK